MWPRGLNDEHGSQFTVHAHDSRFEVGRSRSCSRFMRKTGHPAGWARKEPECFVLADVMASSHRCTSHLPHARSANSSLFLYPFHNWSTRRRSLVAPCALVHHGTTASILYSTVYVSHRLTRKRAGRCMGSGHLQREAQSALLPDIRCQQFGLRSTKQRRTTASPRIRQKLLSSTTHIDHIRPQELRRCPVDLYVVVPVRAGTP